MGNVKSQHSKAFIIDTFTKTQNKTKLAIKKKESSKYTSCLLCNNIIQQNNMHSNLHRLLIVESNESIENNIYINCSLPISSNIVSIINDKYSDRIYFQLTNKNNLNTSIDFMKYANNFSNIYIVIIKNLLLNSSLTSRLPSVIINCILDCIYEDVLEEECIIKLMSYCIVPDTLHINQPKEEIFIRFLNFLKNEYKYLY